MVCNWGQERARWRSRFETTSRARTSATRGLGDAALDRFRRSDNHTLQHDRRRGRHIGCDRGEHRQHGTHSDHGQQARTHCRRGRFGAGEDLESAAHGVFHSVLKNIASLRWSELYSSANTLRRGTRRIAGEACEVQIRGANFKTGAFRNSSPALLIAPLGGSNMGVTAFEGIFDSRGRMFADDKFHVMDRAIVSRALGQQRCIQSRWQEERGGVYTLALNA